MLTQLVSGVWRSTAVAALCGALGMTASSATAATFSFFNHGGSTGNFSASSGGIDLTVSAFQNWSPAGTGNVAGAIYYNHNRGLGVDGLPDGHRLGASRTAREALVFDFDRTVRLLSFTVSDSSARSEMLTWYAQNGASAGGFTQKNTRAAATDSFDVTPALQGRSFALQTDTEGDGTFLYSVTVADVPVPASGALLGLSLGGAGLGLMARRRRQTRG